MDYKFTVIEEIRVGDFVQINTIEGTSYLVSKVIGNNIAAGLTMTINLRSERIYKLDFDNGL
jgi:hypothetical protein